MSLQKAVQLWSVVLLGLSHIGTRCDARAVNVSNTWTMPQEGLNVFYRFFRDRISWFEADAVCQFHHANLVTVDNSFQFDATRDLLRELDVNDIVWIGLMRPQSSERFMWANSRPLVTDTGYWAESLPLMDAPLCAVIDPIRDYRWHALRCGGPETASFLCEMPVPSWADSCILKDMPNLTMQYMADTASIELIRNCAEEGLIRQSCKGKEDRERALRELICPRERLEAQRINDITNSHFKSLQIINSIRTDNNENNDIELLPLGESYGIGSDISEQVQTEKNTVQRLIEQFNVDELMQADDPMSSNNNYNNGNSGFKIPGEIPKPVKKAAKKVFVAGDYQKKSKPQKYTDAREQPAKSQNAQPQSVQRPLSLDDMMMGDQPPQSGEPEMLERGQDDDVSNEIMAPLPHKKKILPVDLKTMAPITERSSQQQQASDEEEQRQQERREKELMEAMKKIAATTTTTTTTTTAAPSTTTTMDSSSSSTTTTQPTTTTTASATSSSSTTAPPTATTTTAPQTNAETTTTATTTPSETTAEPVATFGTESPAVSTAGASAAVATETAGASATVATQPPATIGHPMHPQQPRSNVITEETQHPHIKESADNSHFIPPMLLVKSHYVPPLKHSEHGAEHHAPHRGEATTSSSADSSATLSDAKEPKEPMATTATAAPAATTINEESTPKVAVDLDASSATSPDSTTTTTTTITTTASAAETSTLKAAVEAAAEAAVVIAKELTRLGQTHAKLIDDSALSKNQAAEQMAEAVEARQPNVLSPAPKTTILKPVGDNAKLADNTTKIDNAAAAATTATSTITTTTTTTAPDMKTTGSAAISAAKSADNNKPHATLSTTTTQEDKAATKEEVDEEEDAGEEGSAQAQLEPKEIAQATTQAAELHKAPIKTTTTTTATTTTQTVAATQPEPKEAHKAAVEDIASTNAPTAPPTTTTGTITTAQTTTTTVVEGEGEGEALATIPAKSARAINHHRGHGEHGGFGHGHNRDHRTTTEEPTSTHNFLKEATEPPFHPNRKRVLTQPETVSYFKKILG